MNIIINLQNYGKIETLMNNKNPNYKKEKKRIVLEKNKRKEQIVFLIAP